jgi:hypothetical protein
MFLTSCPHLQEHHFYLQFCMECFSYIHIMCLAGGRVCLMLVSSTPFHINIHFLFLLHKWNCTGICVVIELHYGHRQKICLVFSSHDCYKQSVRQYLRLITCNPECIELFLLLIKTHIKSCH